MPRLITLFLAALICCLPTFVSAATNCSIHAEWSQYTPPSGYTVAGYKLYQEGQLACQTSSPAATSIDCLVSMDTNTADFTLTAAFADGTQSPHSAPFSFSIPSLDMEAGEVLVNQIWKQVSFESTFNNPVVIAGPLSYNGNDPSVVRVRNVSKTGFEIRLTEWNYLDGNHTGENVRYLVMEKGRTTLPDGSFVEAGSFTGTTSFKTVQFSGPFAKTPVVLTTVASTNETDTISGRLMNIGLTSFAYYFREQEKNTNTHANETVNYIAWEPGKGTIGSLQFEVATTGNSVAHAWHTKAFQNTFNQVPIVLADMQSTNGTDTAALRMQKVTATNFQVIVEEEKSLDSEVSHCSENVGYIALNSEVQQTISTTIWPSSTVPATVDAGSDSAQELGVKFRSDLKGFITGIRFYKASTNTGTHVANLWTSTGTRLATATFTNETASGWQQVNFSTPVAIAANTVYVASYHCATGHQSVDRNYFAGKGMDSAPLHALADGISGSNGVYAYSSSSVFPNNTYLSSNYWVDVVFQQ